ncbi:hypothetical protein [Mycolicibacterium novocastrense]|uniref:hypothetical protein n=1 Tax=Mycolicibacterium novocastrense TaxID=59813 RepID=UPI000A66B006|nr:hypothetical protein [Mycolicibacterium novocastrense]
MATVLNRAIAAALLSAALATPAVAGLTTGIAAAKPRQANCAAIAASADSAIHVANVARQQGDKQAEKDWNHIANRTLDTYHRLCLS